jgi:hypothetical protein
MSALAGAAPASASSGSSGNSSSSGGAPAAGGNAQATGSGQAPAPNGQNGATQQPGETKAEAVARFKRTERVNGKDVEFEATEDELWASHRRQAAVQQKAREFAAEQKKLAAEREEWQREKEERTKDPFIDIRKRMEAEGRRFDKTDYLNNLLQQELHEEGRDPRDRELSAKDAEIQRLKRAEMDRVNQEKQVAERRAEDRELAQLGSTLAAALQKMKFAKNDLVMDILAKEHFTAEEESGLQLSADELAEVTKGKITETLDSIASEDSGMSDEDILNAFPNFSKRVHRGIVARYKAKQGGTPGAVVTKQAEVKPEGPLRKTEAQIAREEFERTGIRRLRGV